MPEVRDFRREREDSIDRVYCFINSKDRDYFVSIRCSDANPGCLIPVARGNLGTGLIRYFFILCSDKDRTGCMTIR